MLYGIAHFLRDHAGFVWGFLEWANSVFFAFAYRKKLKNLPSLLKSFSKDGFSVREASVKDVPAMLHFFEAQPKESFLYFKPHGFDGKSLRNIVQCRSFLAFLVMDDNQQIAGYFFLRCFANGKCFKGYMVGDCYRRRGLAILEGLVMNEVASLLGLRLFGSISPRNEASMAAAKAVNELKIIKTLENGDYFIEFLPKIEQ